MCHAGEVVSDGGRAELEQLIKHKICFNLLAEEGMISTGDGEDTCTDQTKAALCRVTFNFQPATRLLRASLFITFLLCGVTGQLEKVDLNLPQYMQRRLFTKIMHP